MIQSADLLSGSRSQNTGGQAPLPIDDEVKFSEEILNSYRGSASQWRTAAQEDWDFRNNNQFTEEQRKALAAKDHAAIPINVLHPAVEQAKAMLTANRPRFSAAAREGSDVKVATTFSDLMEFVWYNSNGNVELKQVVEDYYTRGMGVFCVYVDPNADWGKGEVIIKSIDPFHLYLDPNSQDLYARDSAHMIISREMTKEQIEQMYPQVYQKLEQASPTGGSAGVVASQRVGDADLRTQKDTFHTKYELIDRYTRIKEERVHLIDPVSMYEKVLTDEEATNELGRNIFVEIDESESTRWIMLEEEVEQVQELVAGIGPQIQLAQDQNGQTMPVPVSMSPDELTERGLAMIPGTRKMYQQVTMADAVAAEAVMVDRILVTRVRRVFSVGGLMVYDAVLPIEEYPIVPLMNRHNRNPYPMSDVRFVRPIQEFINKMISLVIAHSASATGNKLIIPRDSQNKKELMKEWEKAGPSVIDADFELGTPIVSGPTALANEVFVLIQDGVQKVYDILGIYPFQQGAPTNAPDTYKGTVALDEFGQRRLKSKRDDIEECINQLAKVAVQLIQATYTYRKVIRLVRPNNTVQTIEINTLVTDPSTGLQHRMNDVTVGRYDMVMVSGSTMPLNRWALMEYYMNLYEKGIIDNVEVLKQTDVVDAAGVLERVSRVKQLESALAQAEKTIKQLEGDLQTATRESVQDRKRVEVEKYKTSLADLRAQAEAAVSLFETRLSDELNVGRRELKVAAKEAKAATKKKSK